MNATPAYHHGMFYLPEKTVYFRSYGDNEILANHSEEFVLFMNNAIASFISRKKIAMNERTEEWKKSIRTIGHWHGMIWNAFVRNNHSMKWFEIEQDAKQYLSEEQMGELKIIFLSEREIWEKRNSK